MSRLQPGSLRYSLAALAVAALGIETALTLVGGVTTASLGAAVLTAVAVLTARYVAGYDSQDGNLRKRVRLMEERRAWIGDWHQVVEQGLSGHPDATPLLRLRLQRLYAARLDERHAVSLYGQPAAAAALVGPEVWPLIDPARPGFPGPGPVPERALRAAVDRLSDL